MQNKPHSIQPANRLQQVTEYYFSRKLKEVTRLNAEGVSCVGSRFVVYRRSETLARKTGTAHPKVKVNPVRSGIRRRRAIARAERERRNTFFREAAIAQAKQRRKDAGNED